MKYESVSLLCINFDVYHCTTMACVTAEGGSTSRQQRVEVCDWQGYQIIDSY